MNVHQLTSTLQGMVITTVLVGSAAPLHAQIQPSILEYMAKQTCRYLKSGMPPEEAAERATFSAFKLPEFSYEQFKAVNDFNNVGDDLVSTMMTVCPDQMKLLQ